MTAPRQVLPRTTYLVTRRCAQRMFFLRPSEATNQTCLFLLAVAASRYGIRLHAFCFLSNHYHLVLSDPGAHLPKFMQYLNALIARSLNASIGHWEDFWDARPYSAVSLLSPADVVDKTAYALANPVAAGLVRSARNWPGLWSDPDSFGSGPRLLQRPKHFFDPDGSLPETASLELKPPPCFVSAAAFRDQVLPALAEREADAVRRTTRFLGILKVLAQRPFDRPRSREPRRGLSPRVACRDKWRRIEALGRLVGFLRDYRDALLSWRSDRSVLFPAGTYLMRVAHGAACAGAA